MNNRNIKSVGVILVAMIVAQMNSRAGVVNYTFDEAGGALLAQQSDIGNTSVSLVTYTQGTEASGAGSSSVAYESNVPSDNLFAISSADIGGANASYQANDSRLEFDLTVGVGETMSFSTATLDFDLLAMDASEAFDIVVNARLFYNINGAGWQDASGGYHQVKTASDPLDHTLNTSLYADFTDALLVDSVTAGADVYESSFSVGLSAIGTLNAGDNVEFALFVWDSGTSDNTSFYAGVDNVKLDAVSVVPEPATVGLLGFSCGLVMLFRRIFV